jgi:hypothetical protein
VATTGVVGQRWRAHVTPAGAVEPHDGSPPLRWYVFAGDRWHDPASGTAVRHERVAGTAVFETRMRIPGGDAVQRVWSVADRSGYTLVSVENDSPTAVAVALTRRDLVTSRPPADVPIEGIDLPAEAIVLPVGHRASVTVGIAHTRRGDAPLPTLPGASAVVHGWITRTDVASRLDLPQQALVESVRTARCELLLGDLAAADDQPERYLLGLGDLVRLGELDAAAAAASAPDVARAVTAAARRHEPLRGAALDAAGVVLHAAGEQRALADLEGLRVRDVDNVAVTTPDGDIAAVAAVERRIAAGPKLFPHGIPEAWRGQHFEAHGLVAGPASRLSLAVRWHGANPALLWEVTGESVELSADTVVFGRWSTTDRRGEVLWSLSTQ